MTIVSAAASIPTGLVVPQFLYYFSAIYFVAYRRPVGDASNSSLEEVQCDSPKRRLTSSAWWLKPLATREAEFGY